MAKTNKKLLIHETLVLGLGLLDMTKDKIGKVVSEVTKGISKQDKKKAVDRLLKYAESTRKNAEKTVSKQVKKVLGDIGLEIKRTKK